MCSEMSRRRLLYDDIVLNNVLRGKIRFSLKEIEQAPDTGGACGYTMKFANVPQGLLKFVVILVVVDHAFPDDLNGLEIFEHDSFATLCASAARHVVDLFAVRE